MREISRRRLLTGIFSAGANAVRSEVAQAEKSISARPQARIEQWVHVGSIADFPPGETFDVAISGVKLRIWSHSEGLRACELDESQRIKSYLPIRLERGGRIAAQLGGHWPKDTVLSILTGEQTPFEGEGVQHG
jgi:hypothetical protein